MSDIALIYDSESGGCDIALAGGDLVLDEGLRTAVLISLFADARARSDDPLPQPGADRRGWWGDAYADQPNDEIGSRLWLLDREKIVPSVLARALGYAEEALAWLTRDRIARAVDVAAEAQRPQTLAIAVGIDRPTGPDRQRFDFLWEAS